MEDSKKVNYIKKPLPSTPGPKQIQVTGQENKKGGSDMYSTFPAQLTIDTKKK